MTQICFGKKDKKAKNLKLMNITSFAAKKMKLPRLCIS